MEIVLTLETAVDYVEDDELQPSNVNPVTPHKYSDLRPLSGSSITTCKLAKAAEELNPSLNTLILLFFLIS